MHTFRKSVSKSQIYDIGAN